MDARCRRGGAAIADFRPRAAVARYETRGGVATLVRPQVSSEIPRRSLIKAPEAGMVRGRWGFEEGHQVLAMALSNQPHPHRFHPAAEPEPRQVGAGADFLTG